MPPQWLHVGVRKGLIFVSGLEIRKPKDNSISVEIFSIEIEDPGARNP